MSGHSNNPKAGQKDAIRQADEALLASLGYKQEFKRAFTPLEVRQRAPRAEGFPILSASLDHNYIYIGIWDSFLYHRAFAVDSLRSLLCHT
jgi:hypothetical protein